MNASFYVSTRINKDGTKDITVGTIKDMDCRKSQLYISEYGEKRIADEAKRLHDLFKKTSSYSNVSIGFDTIDWYDSMTNIYEVPCFNIKKGARKVTVGYDDHGDIPKDWEMVTTISFKGMTQVKPIFKALVALNISFDTKTENKIRKAIKKGERYSYDNWE